MLRSALLGMPVADVPCFSYAVGWPGSHNGCCPSVEPEELCTSFFSGPGDSCVLRFAFPGGADISDLAGPKIKGHQLTHTVSQLRVKH